jgi:asparagine synthase (glutamine-hydrolysing)
MANSLEARPAFLDHHLVEYAVTLPPNMRIRDRKDKYILRETMRHMLPKTLYERQKFAFMAPPAHTDPVKEQAMLDLAETYLSPAAISGGRACSTWMVFRQFFSSTRPTRPPFLSECNWMP